MSKSKTLISALALSVVLGLSACGDGGTPPDAQQGKQEETPVENEAQEDNEKKESNDASKEEKDDDLETVALDEIKQEKDAMEVELEETQDELNYYKKYVQQVYLQLPEKKQNALKEKEWEYRLLVNGVGFPKNGVIEVEAPRLEVVMSESRVPYSVIPQEDSDEAQLDSSIKSSFMMKTKEGFEVEEDIDEENGTYHTIKYLSDNVEEGEIYEIEITDALKDKLKLQTNQLTIKVN